MAYGRPQFQNHPRRSPHGRRRRRFSPRKAARLFLPLIFFMALCIVMCVPNRPERPADAAEHRREQAEAKAGTAKPATKPKRYKADDVNDLEKIDSVTFYQNHLPDMPEPTERIHVNYFGNLRQLFNDSNYVHWDEGERFGIEPITDTRSHWQLKRPIVKVTSCEDFWVDTLKFSRPYLVPEAAARLHEIGRRFRDTIAARGGGDYRLKVTSLLRTPHTIKRLRRRNRNAVDSSVHQLATTFDISYASYIANAPSPARSVDDLKGILAEVLRAMKFEGKIWVKYEVGQPCFHITARKPEE